LEQVALLKDDFLVERPAPRRDQAAPVMYEFKSADQSTLRLLFRG